MGIYLFFKEQRNVGDNVKQARQRVLTFWPLLASMAWERRQLLLNSFIDFKLLVYVSSVARVTVIGAVLLNN